jgi:AcrR family transcriptional regulator
VTDQPAARADIPPVLAIAWGRTSPSTRGPKAGLSPDAIVTAAIELADAEGLAAVSMGRVAERLGYTPMSLYRHVPSKEALLALVQDAAFGDPPASLSSRGGWREDLAAWARGVSSGWLAHPWVLDIPISGPPAMPRSVAWLERALVATADTPLSLGEQLSVALLLSGYARSWAQLERDLQRGRDRSGLSDEQVYPEYQRVLLQLVEPDRFPAVHAVISEGMFDEDAGAGGEGDDRRAGDDRHDGGEMEDEFEFGLQRILDGIEAHIDRRSR